MERSEKNRLSHKTKEKQIKPKGNSKKIKEPTQNNLVNSKISIIPKESNLKNNQNLPIQDAASYYQIKPQNISSPQPVIVAVPGEGEAPQACIINQTVDGKIKFSRDPQQIICPYCRRNVLTTVEDKCNFFSIIIFFIMMTITPIFIFYLLVLDNKDCICEFSFDILCAKGFCCTCCRCPSRNTLGDCQCCVDVEHYCSYCGKYIGIRNSCIEICPPCCRCCF